METQEELIERLVAVTPSERQLNFQETEFYAFVHFTVNTFTDKEWGDGTEEPAIFNPTKLDAEQWVKAIVDAGMRGLILTCKHHDGFCLWPSKLTNHTVAYSPFGRDVVREVSDACRKYGIKFGVYLSPWDRNCKLYGQGRDYDDFFVGQLRELLTGYGDVFCVWFDGACGEGENGKKQYYDWDRYYAVIRELQPGACINVCGPDVRWCGNEAGHTRPAEWSVVPARTRDTEKIAENSQKEDNEEFRQRKISAWDQDLGSRELLANEKELVWYPAEVNTSIRPGWFWHESENDKVRSLADLMHVYENSVGGNATFLLNVPPTNEGLFHENDVKRLHEIGEYLRREYAVNLAAQDGAAIEAQEDGRTILITFPETVSISHVVLQEDIRFSQRVESFRVEAKLCSMEIAEERHPGTDREGPDTAYKTIYRRTVIGYKKIMTFDPPINTDSLRIVIEDCRREPKISFVGAY